MAVKRRVVRSGVRVTALKGEVGRSATLVHVEVDRQRLEDECGAFGAIREVVAKFPDERGGKLRWTRERMIRASTTSGPAGHEVEAFSGAHYGPCDADRYGVGVEVHTDAGALVPHAPGETYAVHAPNTPGESTRLHLGRDPHAS